MKTLDILVDYAGATNSEKTVIDQFKATMEAKGYDVIIGAPVPRNSNPR